MTFVTGEKRSSACGVSLRMTLSSFLRGGMVVGCVMRWSGRSQVWWLYLCASDGGLTGQSPVSVVTQFLGSRVVSLGAGSG